MLARVIMIPVIQECHSDLDQESLDRDSNKTFWYQDKEIYEGERKNKSAKYFLFGQT